MWIAVNRIGTCCFTASENGLPYMIPTTPKFIRLTTRHTGTLSWLLVVVFMQTSMMPPARAQAQSSSPAERPVPADGILIDDFESYSSGSIPAKWRALYNDRLVALTPEFMNDREWFEARRENGNGYVRAFSSSEAAHINKGNGDGFDWNTRTHPVLSWDWRAIDLPAGAREDDDSRNDSGAGVYVLFSIDGRFIKRPKAIKYVYSSTLPVGTVVTYGKLKVVVVSSARNGAGDWEHIERNVVEDYRRLFGDEPPAAPLYIRLWSDSDNMGVISRADFDNVMLLTGR